MGFHDIFGQAIQMQQEALEDIEESANATVAAVTLSVDKAAARSGQESFFGALKEAKKDVLEQLAEAKKKPRGDDLKDKDFFAKDNIVSLTKNGAVVVNGRMMTDATPPMASSLEIDTFIADKEELPGNYGLVEEVNKKIYPKETDGLTISAGKRLISIDRNLYGPDKKNYVFNSEPKKGRNFVADPLRGRYAKYWTKDPEKKQMSFLSGQDVESSVPFGMSFLPVFDDEESYKHGLEKGDFGRTWQWALLTPKKNHFQGPKGSYSSKLWKTYIQGGSYSRKEYGAAIVPAPGARTIKEDALANSGNRVASIYPGFKPTDRNSFNPTEVASLQSAVANTPERTDVFFDHSFEMNLPFTEKEIKKLNPLFGSKLVEIKAVYNFLIEGYENTISDNLVSEKTLPNMYVMLSEREAENPPAVFRDLITLNGNLKTDERSFSRLDKQKYDIRKHPVGQYFDLYGSQYKEILQRDTLQNLKNTFSNIMLPISDLKMLREQKEKKEMFPMFFDITFSTDKGAYFAEALREANLMDYMTNVLVSAIENKNFKTIEYQSSREIVTQGKEETTKEVNFITSRRRMWSMNKWLNNSLREVRVRNGVFLGENDNTVKAENGEQFKLYNSLMRIIITDKTNKLVKSTFRSYEDILNGELAHNETVLYRIAKFEGRTISGDPIQNFYFPNSLKEDVIRYVDTQVKYDKEYTYAIYAYQLVVGNKYWYDQVNATNSKETARCKVFQEPSLVLVEIPYYTFVGRIVDSPPVKPDVNVVPYKSMDKRLLFTFNTGVGEYKDDPIIIEGSEEAEIRKIRALQKVDPDEPIEFKSDDGASIYEVYRLEKKPKSYSDFAKQLRASVRTDVDPLTAQKATSAAFIDSVKANKKYYYTFRAVDVHGHKSNPTALYEVELVNDSGTVYPVINLVDFDKPLTSYNRIMKKYIQITPSIFQGLIDDKKSGFDKVESASDLPSGVQLGVAEESLWNKKFKLILTSKSSGKKMHVNFDFKHEHVTTETK